MAKGCRKFTPLRSRRSFTPRCPHLSRNVTAAQMRREAKLPTFTPASKEAWFDTKASRDDGRIGGPNACFVRFGVDNPAPKLSKLTKERSLWPIQGTKSTTK